MSPRKFIFDLAVELGSVEAESLPVGGADTLRLREDLGLDSVAIVDLIVGIEHKFKIWFDPLDEGMDEVFTTVEALCAYVERKLA